MEPAGAGAQRRGALAAACCPSGGPALAPMMLTMQPVLVVLAPGMLTMLTVLVVLV